jgi:hypothetical protein
LGLGTIFRSTAARGPALRDDAGRGAAARAGGALRRGRPWLLLGLALALLAAAAYNLRGVAAGAGASASVVQHTYRVIGAADELLSTLKDAETGQRGYLLTGDPAYLAPYEDAAARVRARLHGLETLSSPTIRRKRRGCRPSPV